MLMSKIHFNKRSTENKSLSVELEVQSLHIKIKFQRPQLKLSTPFLWAMYVLRHFFFAYSKLGLSSEKSEIQKLG